MFDCNVHPKAVCKEWMYKGILINAGKRTSSTTGSYEQMVPEYDRRQHPQRVPSSTPTTRGDVHAPFRRLVRCIASASSSKEPDAGLPAERDEGRELGGGEFALSAWPVVAPDSMQGVINDGS